MRARHERSEPRDERREGKASEAKVERQELTLYFLSPMVTNYIFTPSLTRCSLRSPLVTNGVSDERGT